MAEYANTLRRTAVGDVLRRNAGNTPTKPALIVPAESSEDHVYTWAELNAAINKVGNSLQAMGVSEGEKIGIFSANSARFVILTFATMKIGAVIAPVGAELRGEELSFVIEHSDAKLLFVDNGLTDPIADVAGDLPEVQFGFLGDDPAQVPSGWINFDSLLATNDDAEPVAHIDADDVASLTYTSGTEAAPKGVMMTHNNLANLMTTLFHWGVRPEDVTVHVLPLFYTGGMGVVTSPLLMGQTVVLLDIPHPERILDAMSTYSGSFIVLPPTLWIRLLQVPGVENKARSLRIATTFGATISESMIKGWNSVNPELQWISYYGQSETSCSGTVGRFQHFDEIREGDLGWVGKAAHDLDVRVVDDQDEDVPVGEVGQIIFRGPAVFKGYYKDAAKTAEVFRNGWLHSGDLGRVNADGELFFVDRAKDLIKSGGENISSASVEYAVSGHPKVAEVAAFGVPDPEWMEALTVAVSATAGEIIGDDEVIEFCREHLPRFKVPKHVVVLDEFPRGPSGKILKRELRTQYQ